MYGLEMINNLPVFCVGMKEKPVSGLVVVGIIVLYYTKTERNIEKQGADILGNLLI